MTPDEQSAYVDAAAALLDLPIGPYRDGVLRYFALAASMYTLIDAFPLATHDESIEVFVPLATDGQT